ncbi:MAG: hypothetical protein AB7J63_15715 [Vicinamibacterales bacterium]
MRIVAGFLVLLLGLAAAPIAGQASADVDAEQLVASLKSNWPDLYARLVAIERAQGVFLGALAQGRDKVKEPEIYRLMTRRVTDPASSATPDPEAEKGYAALGARAAEVIRRAHEFQREVLAVYASVEPDGVPDALDAVVDRYLSRPDVSLPDTPKDMEILYDHPYTSFVDDPIDPKRDPAYTTLTGVFWAGHWFELAALEPFEMSTETAQRQKDLKIVADRFLKKLAKGKLPESFPEEVPLAPSIAPGLVMIHERSAAILDNLNMMKDVMAETLANPAATDVQAQMDGIVALFTDRKERVVEVDDWITVALRHSIFAQGGPALGTMTQSDRNGSGHLQHSKRATSIPPGGMR